MAVTDLEIEAQRNWVAAGSTSMRFSRSAYP